MMKYQRNPEAIFALIDKDVVALHVERGMCFGMEKVSADVWNMIEQPITFDEICERLRGRYAVGSDQCRTEVQQLIHQMFDEGLVKAVA